MTVSRRIARTAIAALLLLAAVPVHADNLAAERYLRAGWRCSPPDPPEKGEETFELRVEGWLVVKETVDFCVATARTRRQLEEKLAESLAREAAAQAKVRELEQKPTPLWTEIKLVAVGVGAGIPLGILVTVVTLAVSE